MNRPFIVVLSAASLDGRISLGPNRTMWQDMEDSRSLLPGDADVWKEVEKRLHDLHQFQGDMLGSNSLVREGEELRPLPSYTGCKESLYQDYLPPEVVERPEQRGWLIVVDGRGRVRSGYKGEDRPGWHMLHLVSHGVPGEYLFFLRNNRIPYLITGERRVNLPEAMGKLYSKLKVKRLLVGAGGKLSGALLRAGLVDEVNVIVKPMLIGGFETPCLFDSPDLGVGDKPARLRLISAQVQTNGFIWLRYSVEMNAEVTV